MPQQDVKAIVKRYLAETDSQTGKWTCSCRKTLPTCMADVKSIFEQMCIDYPIMSKYLKPDAKIIHAPDFEHAITKIQNCTTDTLSEEEIEQLSNLKYSETSGREETQNPENESDFAASIIKKRKIPNPDIWTRIFYFPLRICLRFFSTICCRKIWKCSYFWKSTDNELVSNVVAEN